jgi:formiminoglutamate deiminase
MATVTTLHFREALLPSGFARDVRLALDGGRIASVETAADPLPGDCRHGIALPGLCNLHSHAFQRAMAGLAERRGPTADSFWTWRETMYRFALAMTPDDVEAVATLLFCEMLEAGFTRVGEFHYLHHDADGGHYGDIAEMASRIAAAAGASGIGLTLLPVFYAHAGFGGQPPAEGQRRFICGLRDYARLLSASERAVAALPDATIGLAPHSLRAVTAGELREVIALANGRPIHIHAAEQTREVDESLAFSGLRPVEWLLREAGAGHGWCLVHATHMTDAETAALARSGATAGLCPITEANLGDGFFPLPGFIDAGGAFGVGSDSNVEIGVSGELRLLEYGQRLALRQRNVTTSPHGPSTGRALYSRAFAGAAAALGVTAAGLAVGAPADIVTLDPAHPALAGRSGDALLDGWIFAGGNAVIDRVWRNGREVVTGGRHVRRDAARRRFAAVLARLAAA